MDVVMALATLFFVLLLLSSAAISFLLLRLCVAALRPFATTCTPTPLSTPIWQEHRRRSTSWPCYCAPMKAPKEEPRRLAWREVEALTGGFDEVDVVGRGGSSNAVYLARQRVGGSAATVKVHRWCGGGERRLTVFRRELDLLRRVGEPRYSLTPTTTVT